ncbi:Retrovirus-related Pol polyprotein from transposon [Dictyocoela muelleri]|nr:Retrovirus-related Pol polyprotein from transposon [Dictyocoela muelleri]
MKHFKQIIFGAHTIIHTDNKNLTFRDDLTKRMNRWLILLEEYNYEIKHVKGDLNSEADLLSRLFVIIPDETQINNANKLILNKLNEKMNEIKVEVNKNNPIKEIENKISELHKFLIHPGRNKMLNMLKKSIILKNMKKIITKTCKECIVCAREKSINPLMLLPNLLLTA